MKYGFPPPMLGVLESVLTSDGRPSDIWDRLSSPNGGSYVSDIFTDTPAFNAFSPGIPQCGNTPVVGPPAPAPSITIAVGQDGGAQRAGGQVAPAGSHWVIVDFHNFAPNAAYTAQCIEDNHTWYTMTNLRTDGSGNGHYTDTCFWGSADSPQVGVLASNNVLSNVILWPPAPQSTTPAPAGGYQIITNGPCATIRTGPATSFQASDCLENGTAIAIECQTHGEGVLTSDGRASDIWDRLSSPDAGGYVSDILTNTPAFNAFSPGLSQCNGVPVVGPPTPASTDCEAFVADVTVPDGTKINKGTNFVKTWKFRNCGTTDWSGLIATRIGGSFGPTSFGLPITRPGATADVSVTMTAPSIVGHARVTYQMRGFQQGMFWADINVVSSGGPPPGAPRYVALGDSIPYGHGIANPGAEVHSGIPPNEGPSSFAYPTYVAQALGMKLGVRTSGCQLSGDQLAVSGAPSSRNNADGSADKDCPATADRPHKAVDPDELAAANIKGDPPKLVTIQVGADDISFDRCLASELRIPAIVYPGEQCAVRARRSTIRALIEVAE